MNRKLFSLLCLALAVTTASLCASPVRDDLAAKNIADTDSSAPLPYGAIPVEYIESTGTQYIDTGVQISSSVDITAKIEILTLLNYYDIIIGGRNSNSNNGRWIFPGGNVSSLRLCYGAAQSGVVGRPSGGPYTFSKVGNNCYVDDVLKYSITGTLDEATKKNIWLFSGSGYANPLTWRSAARIFFCCLIEDGEIVFDCIPVRFPNELGEWEGAMYDFVSETLFRNQGTGSFIIGPDL